MADTKIRVRSFLAQFTDGRELGYDENIFASGFVNSLAAMQLVLFVESEFGITVEDSDLVLSNFSSVNAIAALVERKQSAAPALESGRLR